VLHVNLSFNMHNSTTLLEGCKQIRFPYKDKRK